MKAATSNESMFESSFLDLSRDRVSTAKGIWSKFIAYAENQQSKRLLWLAIGVLGHGVLFTIATLMVVIFTGNVFALYAIALFNMAMVLVVNLAALPTKYTIPVFFLSLLIDLGVILAAIGLYV